VKQDILNDTNTADEKYKNWITEHKNKIIPVFDKKYTTLEYIKDHHQCFIKNMIYMLNILENNNYKMFQFLPLRTSLIPRNICVDTKTLIELFVNDNTVSNDGEHQNKNEYFDDIKQNKDKIWNKVFNLNNKVFKMSKVSPYVFNYKIMTDGYSVTLFFIHKDDIEKKDKSDNNKQAMRATNKQLYKDKSEEEIKEIKNNKEKTKEENKLLSNIKNREKTKSEKGRI